MDLRPPPRGRPSGPAPDGPTPRKAKAQAEARIAEAIVSYHRGQVGRGPESARAFLFDDMIVVRQKGTLTPAEARLARTADGWDLIHRLRRKLAEVARDELSQLIENLTHRKVLDHFSDTSRNGDRIEIFVLASG